MSHARGHTPYGQSQAGMGTRLLVLFDPQLLTMSASLMLHIAFERCKSVVCVQGQPRRTTGPSATHCPGVLTTPMPRATRTR